MPRFTKGQSAGADRPLGCRNKAALMLDAVAREAVVDALNMVHEKSTRQGDLRAASILLARLWPVGPRPVELELPAVDTAAGVMQAQAAVIAAIADQSLTPAEAASVSTVLDNQRKAIETGDHEQRIAELEAARRRQ
jgi:hypothetical protein